VKALGDDKIVQAVLDDYRTAPIDERLRAMLAFLEKLTLRPDELDERDAAALRAAGIDQAAAESAIHVAFVFCVMDRLADAFDFRLNDARGLRWVARILIGVGYGAGCVPG
jgi:alkylhydroperoxidase family enzyme